MALLGALMIYSVILLLVMRCLWSTLDGDSSNSISWTAYPDIGPWKFRYILNEIRSIAASIKVVSRHVRVANEILDSLTKEGQINFSRL